MFSGGEWRLGHRQTLDGLRGVAILLVLTGHFAGAVTGWRYGAVGAAGVGLFFVLSGFLITSQLVERVEDGRLSMSLFYRDRALRLLPALYVFLALTIVFAVAMGRPWLHGVTPVLFNYSNWVRTGSDGLGVWGIAWSLSIEEQFYIVWPWALLLSMRWRHGPAAVAIVGILASTALRFTLVAGPGGWDRVYYGSDTRAAALLCGCLLAWWAHRGLRVWRIPGWLVTLGAVATFAWIFDLAPLAAALVVPTVMPVVGAALVWAAAGSPSVALTSPLLRYLGARSYALYLWHYPLARALPALHHSGWWIPLALALSLGLAEASWRLVERPCMRMRGRVSAAA